MAGREVVAEKKIGVGVATIISFNAMVGAGVLLMPTILSKIVGPAGVLTLAFSVLLVLSMGLSLGRAASVYPGDSWSYLYTSKWAGHKIGMLSSFLYIFGLLVAMGVLVQQAGIWVHGFVKFIPPTPLGVYILLILMLLILSGAKTSSWTQYFIAFLVISSLFLSGIFGWMHFNPENLIPFMPNGVGSVFAAGPSLVFAFLGFECATSLYSIVKKPRSNVPKALLFSIVAVGLLYFTFVFGILYSIPRIYFAGGVEESLSSVLSKFFVGYPFLGFVVSIGAVFGIIGTLHSVLWSIAELLTGVLKKTKSQLVKTLFVKKIWNDKVSVLFSTSIMLIASLLIQGEQLVAITALFVVSAYMLSIASLLYVKEEWKNRRNIVTVIALVGGVIMIWFSGQSALNVITGFFS